MTNKQWLAKLPAEEWWNEVARKMAMPGDKYQELKDTFTAWLEEEHENTRQDHIRFEVEEALKAYRKTLENESIMYHQTFEAYAENNRRSRELALGTCALKAMDAVRVLQKTKKLIGGLEFLIAEKPEKDAGGKKIFHDSVTFYVQGAEKAHSKEDIDKEIEETFEKMMRETDEMFPEG